MYQEFELLQGSLTDSKIISEPQLEISEILTEMHIKPGTQLRLTLVNSLT